MNKNELVAYFNTHFPSKDVLNDEELNWILQQDDVDWAINSVLQARQNANTSQQYERNKRYWSNPVSNLFNNWISGVPLKDVFKNINERGKASIDSNTSVINGAINVGVPTALLYSAIKNPFGTLGAIGVGGSATLAGDAAINKLTDGKYLSIPGLIQDKIDLSRLTSELVNPLMILGGKYGYKGGTALGSKLFNGLHLPIGYDPVDGWYRRKPYPITWQEPTINAGQLTSATELGLKPFTAIEPTITPAVEGSTRRAAALASPTELTTSGQAIVTPPMDLSRGTWDFYRNAMQENPVLALPSVQAWLQQYGDLRTPQQWMLAGTRNLNLQSGRNNPRSALFNAFGNVYFRDGMYKGTMPSFATDVVPTSYTFTPGAENPMIGTLHIDGAPPFNYNLTQLPFAANFEPVIREGRILGTEGNTMRLSANSTRFTGTGTPGSYLEVFDGPISRAQQVFQRRNMFFTGQLPRRGTIQFAIGNNGNLMTTGTNIFGNQLWLRTVPDGNGGFEHRWTEIIHNNDPFAAHPVTFNNDFDVTEFVNNLGPLTDGNAQLEPVRPTPHPGQSAVDYFMEKYGKHLTAQPSKPRTVLDPFSGPSQNRGLSLPGNMGHYQLKSLMQGSPLEKQLSKDGTININSLNTHLKKASDIERVIVEKVLQTKFPNQKSVDYNQLKLEVQKELIQNYSRKPQSKWTTYGLDRLGYSTDKVSDGAGGIFEITPDGKVQTFTFESDQIPTGHAKHYDPSSLGHVRLFTSNDAPQILYILENQSDWGQSTNLLASDAPARTPVQMEFDFSKRINAYLAGKDDALLSEFQTEDAVNQYFNKLQVDRIKNDRRPARYQGTQQQIYLHDNYLYRQLHEILRLAAQQKQTAVRFPTRETAAKIEQYPQKSAKIDKLSEGYEGLQELVDKLYALQDQYVQAKVNWDIYRQGTGRNLTIEEDVTRRPDYAKFQKEMKGLAKQINAYPGSPYRIRAVDAKDIGTSIFFDLYEVVDPRKQEYAYENILKKYSDFPKMWKKLFKTEPRIVTDSKGNTWYEVDVPEGYLDQEWQFKQGGKINYLSIF